jgi:Lipocalin-like domain
MTLTADEARERMIGGWKLLSFTTTLTSPSGLQTTKYNMGLTPLGRLLFTADGWISTIGNDSSKIISPSGPWIVALDAEIALVARHMLTYWGAYRVFVEGEDVRLETQVHVALDPSLVGTKQERRLEFRQEDGRELLVLWPVGDFIAPVSE